MDHAERDKRIIAHLAAYRASLQVAMTRLYFAGKPERATNVLSRLKKNGYIKSHQLASKTRLVYYQLDGRAVREFGISQKRAEPFDDPTLTKHLAIMWWCCVSGEVRYRIEPSEAAKVVGCESLRGEHAIQASEPMPRLYRVLYVGNATNKTAMKSLRESIRESLQVPQLTEWIEHGRYTFVLLVDESPKKKYLLDRVKTEQFKDEFSPLPHVRVYRTATPSTAHEMINEHAANTKSR